MNTIKLNNDTYEVLNFSKNTQFNADGIFSNASCSIKTSDISTLYTYADTGVQTIQIYHDSNLIYNLENVNGHLQSIDEYLMDDHMNINVNIILDFNVNEPESNE